LRFWGVDEWADRAQIYLIRMAGKGTEPCK
jgi:hypothetical protein